MKLTIYEIKKFNNYVFLSGAYWYKDNNQFKRNWKDLRVPLTNEALKVLPKTLPFKIEYSLQKGIGVTNLNIVK